MLDCACGFEEAVRRTVRPSRQTEPSDRREPSPKRVRVDEVGELALAVHLDHGQVLAVARLELGVAGDVDELQLEAELGPRVVDDLERALAEPAVRRVVERDPRRYGYRPRVVVASVTR